MSKHFSLECDENMFEWDLESVQTNLFGQDLPHDIIFCEPVNEFPQDDFQVAWANFDGDMDLLIGWARFTGLTDFVGK